MSPKICVSIRPDETHIITNQADQAFELGGDYVEIRFDFFRPDRLQAAMDSVKILRSKAVFTLRSKDQGGKFTGSEHDRVKWLYELADQRPMLLDVELQTLQQNDELADFLESQKTPMLVSWHDFTSTPPTDRILDILAEMRIYSNYVKIVTMANSIDDSIRLLEMYDAVTGLNPIFFAMGEQGVFSRVMCTVIGNAPFTYASLENTVAPGQLTVTQMRKLYEVMKM